MVRLVADRVLAAATPPAPPPAPAPDPSTSRAREEEPSTARARELRRRAKRLVKGARYQLQGRVYRVILVNDCRARLQLCGGEKVARDFETSTGEAVQFDTWDGQRFLDVSPYSILEKLED